MQEDDIFNLGLGTILFGPCFLITIASIGIMCAMLEPKPMITKPVIKPEEKTHDRI